MLFTIGTTDERGWMERHERADDLVQLTGLISEEVGLRLLELAATVPNDEAVVEIGSFKGKSTCYLATGYTGSAGVFAVDPWDLPGNANGKHKFASLDVLVTFHFQIAEMGLSTKVRPIRQFSREAAAEWNPKLRIGMLFIDGSHLYDDVRLDFDAWSPFVAADGIIAFDDYQTAKNPGVTRFVDELRQGEACYDWDDTIPPLIASRKR